MTSVRVFVAVLLSFLTVPIASAQKAAVTPSAIPLEFQGTWVCKEEGKVVGQLTLTAKKIEWKVFVLDGEDKTMAEQFVVASNPEKVTFDAKVTYSRDVFLGGRQKGDAKVTLQVKDGTMFVEIGGTKTEEAGGVVITTPPKVHKYVKADTVPSSPRDGSRANIQRGTALPPKDVRVFEGTLTRFFALNPKGIGVQGMRVSLWFEEHSDLEFITDVPTAVKTGLFKEEDVSALQMFGKKYTKGGEHIRVQCSQAEGTNLWNVISLEVLEAKK